MPALARPGGPLHYEVTDVTAPWRGEPETILFHHGVGITGDIWLEWLPTLADRYRLVRLDVRGFGRSVVPGRGFGWSMALLADDALAVARAAGAPRFHYVGESLGGTLGLHLAVHHPANILSLTTCSTAHRGGSIQRVHEWRTYIAAHGMAAWSRMMMDLRMAPDVPPRYREWFDREQAKCSADAILDLADMLVATDLTDRLGAIIAPTLVLHPDASPFIPLEMALELHARVPRSELRIFPGARHALAHTHATACASALREFLARRLPARAR
jgi:pimeloyl-ACP methyl ester carboxylesterase